MAMAHAELLHMVRATGLNRLVQLCGTKYQYNGWRTKVTLIHGELVSLKSKDESPYVLASAQYGFTVAN